MTESQTTTPIHINRSGSRSEVVYMGQFSIFGVLFTRARSDVFIELGFQDSIDKATSERKPSSTVAELAQTIGGCRCVSNELVGGTACCVSASPIGSRMKFP